MPGVTPHTLRHTIGSTAISTGEAIALTGAILGHSNPRSTAIYAHIQHEPSRKAANRVSKKIAAVLLPSAAQTGPLTLEDQKLLQALKTRFGKDDTSGRKLREAVVALVHQHSAAQDATNAA